VFSSSILVKVKDPAVRPFQLEPSILGSGTSGGVELLGEQLDVDIVAIAPPVIATHEEPSTNQKIFHF
jgi:hypothetical protein